MSGNKISFLSRTARFSNFQNSLRKPLFLNQSSIRHFRQLNELAEYDRNRKQPQDDLPYNGWKDINENPTNLSEHYDMTWNNAFRQEEMIINRTAPWLPRSTVALQGLMFIGYLGFIAWFFMNFLAPRREYHPLVNLQYDEVKDYVDEVRKRRTQETKKYGL